MFHRGNPGHCVTSTRLQASSWRVLHGWAWRPLSLLALLAVAGCVTSVSIPTPVKEDLKEHPELVRVVRDDESGRVFTSVVSELLKEDLVPSDMRETLSRGYGTVLVYRHRHKHELYRVYVYCPEMYGRYAVYVFEYDAVSGELGDSATIRRL